MYNDLEFKIFQKSGRTMEESLDTMIKEVKTLQKKLRKEYHHDDPLKDRILYAVWDEPFAH